MRLAASNIAWGPEHDDAVADLLVSLGYEGLEVAPTRIFSDPLATSAAERAAFRRRWEARGLRVIAMQALVFGRPDLVLFGAPEARGALLGHLRGMIDLGADLGAHALVFGSPKNRARGAMPVAAATEIATGFFRALGDHAALRGTNLCIEPNPAEYGCDFVRTTDEAIDLVRAVANPGFGLHVDAGAIALNGEDPVRSLAAAAPLARHFHASEPQLAPVGTGSADHSALAGGLRTGGYRGWVSVEMRRPQGDVLAVLRASLERVAEEYR